MSRNLRPDSGLRTDASVHGSLGAGEMAGFPGTDDHRSGLIRNPSVRVGIRIGVAAAFVLVAWVFLANRVSSLEPFAMERNVAAEAVLAFLFLIPIVLFVRRPLQLLLSGLIAWSVFSLAYWLLGFYFTVLTERWSTFQIVAKGFLGYLIAMVITWVISAIRRAQRSRVPRLRPGSILSEPHVPPSDSTMRSA